MKIINTSEGTVLASCCEVADTFFTRFLGLMGSPGLPTGGGLLITPCNSIHMCFMKFPLDLVFIDKNNIVVFIREGIKPWRFTPLIKNANSVIELPVSAIKASKTKIGDKLELVFD